MLIVGIDMVVATVVGMRLIFVIVTGVAVVVVGGYWHS